MRTTLALLREGAPNVEQREVCAALQPMPEILRGPGTPRDYLADV